MKTRQDTTQVRKALYRFGEFELDTSSYALTRSGCGLPVTAKVFGVLSHLVEHRGRVVTKQELLDTFWAGSHVSEVAVPWTICHARRALGQRSSDKQPIETVYGRGYRFIGEVEVVARVADEPPPQTPVARAYTPDSPFVGREQPMTLLRARLAATIAGHGGLCALVGAAGIGKTRCMVELAALARAEGFAVWNGRSTEDTVAPVFWPWIQVLQGVAADRPALREAANGLLSRLDAAELAPDTADLQPEGSAAGFWLFDGVSSVLRDAARQAPVLLLLDDMHCADAGSAHLLSFIAAELQQQSVLVVTAHRDGGSPRSPRELRRLSRHAERIELDPLTPSDVGQYLGAVARLDAPHAELSEALHRATAGNPLFLLQTVRGLIARHGEEALGSLEPELIKAAASARDVLRAGLDVLDTDVRRVLELASVLGEEFEVSTLRELCNVEIEPLLDALEAATDQGFIIAQQPNRFRFCHQLLRSTLYDDLTTTDRVSLHRATADVLERCGDARSRSGEIAHHNYRSLALGDYARVATAAEHAARAAARVHAFTDAAMFCRWALEALALDPNADPRARAQVLLLCGRLEQLGGHAQDAERTIALLVEIARQHGYTDLLVRAARVLRPSHLIGPRADAWVCAILEEALQSAPEGANDVRIRALSQLAWIPPYALDMQRSKEISARALSLARELDAGAPLLEALNARLYALSGPDDIAALLDVADELLARDRGSPTWVSLAALSARHAGLVYRGDLPEAEAVQADLGRISREQKWPDALWAHDRIIAQNKVLEGDFAGAEAAIVELRARAQRQRLSHGAGLAGVMQGMLVAKRDGPVSAARNWHASPPWLSIHDVMTSLRPSFAWLCAKGGHRGPAQSVLETMVGDDGAKLPKEISYLNAMAHLALLAIEFGDRVRAERLYEELAPYPHHNTPNLLMYYEGSVSHFLAGLAAFLGRNEHAARHFSDALDMNEKLRLQPQLAQTCYEYARLLLASGHAGTRKSGRDLKVRAIDLASDLRMHWLVELARALD